MLNTHDRGETRETTDPVGAPMAMPVLDAEGVVFTYGSGATAKPVLADISFSINRGQFVSMVGPSGVGKTTLIKVLSGLSRPTRGSIRIDDRDVTAPPSEMALVLQDYSRSLMPWLTIERNVSLPLRSARLPRTEIADRTRRALAEVGLAGDGGKYPWQLSGGMQQRAAIARALAYSPEVLVMDEPFASVDAQTRFELEDLVLKVRDDYGITVLLVTHDIDEAVYLSDKVIVLAGSPAEVATTIPINLGPERDQIATRRSQAFGDLRSTVLSEIREAGLRTRQSD